MAAAQFTDKQIKAADKEGGKKGQDLAGMGDLGGIKFFCVTMEQCEGEFPLLEAAMEAMNRPVDEAAEDRKGGSGHLGKALRSSNDKQVAFLCYVPTDLQATVDREEWVNRMIKDIDGKITKTTDTLVYAVAEGSADKGLYPLKMREAALGQGFALIKEKGLVMDDSDDDVDYSAQAEAAGIEW